MKADNLLDFLNSNNNIQRGGAIICAMQSIRPDKGWDDDEVETKREKQKKLANKLFELDSEDAIFDLLIVDEAHHMRNETTKSNVRKLIRNISDHCVFLSATPLFKKQWFTITVIFIGSGLFSLSNRTQALRRFKALIDANRPIIEAREIISSGKNNLLEAKSFIREALNNNLLKTTLHLRVA